MATSSGITSSDDDAPTNPPRSKGSAIVGAVALAVVLFLLGLASGYVLFNSKAQLEQLQNKNTGLTSKVQNLEKDNDNLSNQLVGAKNQITNLSSASASSSSSATSAVSRELGSKIDELKEVCKKPARIVVKKVRDVPNAAGGSSSAAASSSSSSATATQPAVQKMGRCDWTNPKTGLNVVAYGDSRDACASNLLTEAKKQGFSSLCSASEGDHRKCN